MSALRLLSVNAHATDGGEDALVELISAQHADLVAVHAGPHLVRWRQAVGRLARRSGLVVLSGGGRGAGSVVLLSSLGVDAGPTRDVRFTGGGGLRPPGATAAALRWRGHDFLFAGVTLIGNSAVRLAQVRELHGALDGVVPGAPPTIISAEGTDRPGTAAWQALVENRVAVAGRIFVDGRIDVGPARELDGHPFTAPVVVELAFA